MKMKIGVLRQKKERIPGGTDVDTARECSGFLKRIKNKEILQFARAYKLGIILSEIAEESKFDSSRGGLYFCHVEDDSQFFMGVSSTPTENDSTSGNRAKCGGRESLHVIMKENVASWKELAVVEIPNLHQRFKGRGGRGGRYGE